MGGCYIEDNASELKHKIGNNKIIVLVYAPWCGHCKEMKGDWEKVVGNLGNRDDLDGFISKIQLDEVPKLKKPVLDDIRGVPTIIYLNKGENGGTFEGKRDAEHIEDWILDKLTPEETPEKTTEKKKFSHDLGKLTQDSIVLKKKTRKPTSSKSRRNRRNRLTNVADKIERIHTMYGGYNWQKDNSKKATKSRTRIKTTVKPTKNTGKKKTPGKKKSPTNTTKRRSDNKKKIKSKTRGKK